MQSAHTYTHTHTPLPPPPQPYAQPGHASKPDIYVVLTSSAAGFFVGGRPRFFGVGAVSALSSFPAAPRLPRPLAAGFFSSATAVAAAAPLERPPRRPEDLGDDALLPFFVDEAAALALAAALEGVTAGSSSSLSPSSSSWSLLAFPLPARVDLAAGGLPRFFGGMLEGGGGGCLPGRPSCLPSRPQAVPQSISTDVNSFSIRYPALVLQEW